MNSIFDSNLRLFKSNRVNLIRWSEEIADLKVLVLAILADSQQDLVISNSLSNITTDELRDMTDIEILEEAHDHGDVSYEVDTIILNFPQDLYRPQSLTFITSQNNNNNLILVKAFPKLQNMMFQWLKNKHGLIIRSLRFSSNFIVETLKFTVDGLVDKSRLGDVEVQFQTRTDLNSLNTITIDVPNEDILRFVDLNIDNNNINDNDLRNDLLDTLYDYLQVQTSINFHKLNIARLRCNFIMITSDGKLKFQRGLPKLERSDEVRFTAWDFLHRIYETIR